LFGFLLPPWRNLSLFEINGKFDFKLCTNCGSNYISNAISLKLKVCPNWPNKATEKFVSLCNPDSEMTALISPCVEEKGTLSIIVFYNGDEKNYSVNELLVRLKLASSDVFNFNYDSDNNNVTDNGKLIAINCVFVSWKSYLLFYFSFIQLRTLDP
jgi:hypothetical protein